MNVIKKLTLDLYRRGVPQTVELVRGDSAAALQLALMCDGSSWEIPQNALVLLRYRNGDYGGEYDTLPDGKTAYSISGNILTVCLAPGVCSMAGDTDFQVVIYVGAAQKSTLRIPLSVQGEVSGSREPESYTNLTQWLLEHSSTIPEQSLAALRTDVDAVAEKAAQLEEIAQSCIADFEAIVPSLEERVYALENLPVYNGEMEDV